VTAHRQQENRSAKSTLSGLAAPASVPLQPRRPLAVTGSYDLRDEHRLPGSGRRADDLADQPGREGRRGACPGVGCDDDDARFFRHPMTSPPDHEVTGKAGRRPGQGGSDTIGGDVPGLEPGISPVPSGNFPTGKAIPRGRPARHTTIDQALRMMQEPPEPNERVRRPSRGTQGEVSSTGKQERPLLSRSFRHSVRTTQNLAAFGDDHGPVGREADNQIMNAGATGTLATRGVGRVEIVDGPHVA